MMMVFNNPTLLNRSNAPQINWRALLICSLWLYSWNLCAADNTGDEGKGIADVLNQAKQALAQDRLTTPAEDNAVKYVEQALAIVPENPEAMKLLEQITDRYDELVATRLKHGEQTRRKSLAQAKILHDRARNIINQHNISSSALVSMKYKIANYNAVNDLEQNEKTSNTGVENLLNQHIALSESALEHNKNKDAQWHAQQADTIANRYELSDEKLRLLKDRILSVTATDKKKDTKSIKELVASHIRLGKHALNEGDTDKAQIHQSMAEEIALQYGIRAPSVQVTKQSVWNKPDTWLKIFGTF